MRRVIQTAAMILTFANAVNAQDFGVIARVDPVASEIKDGWFGKSSVALHLSQGVPFRVFHLDAPARLIVDFKEANWTGVSASDILESRWADHRCTVWQLSSRLVTHGFGLERTYVADRNWDAR